MNIIYNNSGNKNDDCNNNDNYNHHRENEKHQRYISYETLIR